MIRFRWGHLRQARNGGTAVQPTTLVRPDNPPRAIAFVLLGLCGFTVRDAVIKWLSGAPQNDDTDGADRVP